MQSHSGKISFISLILAACLGIFISCSQNTPEIYSTDYSVVFDYSDENTAPSARLSFFASSATDVRRYERIKIKSLENGYCWDTQEIIKVNANDVQWAGCTNIVMPENEKLPTGIYEITYYNADEKEVTFTLDVKFDIAIYDLLLEDLQPFMRKKHGIERIAIYDKEHILIYFGDRTEEFKTTRDIWNRYSNAATYQIIWYMQNGNIICIAPEKPVSPESKNDDEENFENTKE